MIKAILMFSALFIFMIFMIKRRWSVIFRNDLPVEFKVLIAFLLAISIATIPQYFSTANLVVDPFAN